MLFILKDIHWIEDIFELLSFLCALFSLWGISKARTDFNSNRTFVSQFYHSVGQVRDIILGESIFPSRAGTMWRRRAAAMTWTKETTAGRSYTLMFSGFPLTKAFCVPCWEWEHNSLLLPQVSIRSEMHSNTAAHRRTPVNVNVLNRATVLDTQTSDVVFWSL